MKLGQDTKLSIMMVVAAALLLQMSETLEYFSTRRTFNAQLTEMQAVLPKIAKQINEMDLDTLQILVKNLIKEQPQIVGVSIGYLPEFVTKEMDFGNHRYGIYIYENKNVKDSVETVKLKSKDYTERPWFEDILNSNGYWSEPYEGLYNYILMCSYSIPIRNDAGKTVAIMAADIPLREVSAAATKFYEMQRKSALRNFLFNLSGILLLGFIVYRAFSYLRRLNTAYAEKERFTGELNVARDIQESMIPKKFPGPSDRKDLEMFASLTPAREVGGDFYDFLILNDRVCFCIGDVSGKGVPASMLMTVTRTLFRTEARSAMLNLEESSKNDAAFIMKRINHMLCEEQTSGFFATMFIGMIDLKSGNLNYCNAGHEAPLLREKKGDDERASSTFLPVKPNIPVGALTQWDYEGQQTQLQPGDMLFLYTDGLNEAKNIKGEQLGRKRVKEVADQYYDDSAQQLVEHMEEVVKQHAGDAKQSDDITLMAIKWPLNPNDLQTQQDKTAKDQLIIRSSMVDMALLEPFIANAVEQGGIIDKEAKRLRLAVEEAVANVIFHGKATKISLQATVEDDMLLLTIDDDGIPFDPTQTSVTDLSVPADQRPPGGMGIILLHQMTDGLAYQRVNGHNILTIKKKRTL